MLKKVIQSLNIIFNKEFKNKYNYFFIISFFFSFLLILIWLPTFGSEFWAEGGNNFFYYAYHHDLWDNIWKTDANYLPWLQRLISLFLVKICGFKLYFPLAAQIIRSLFVAFFISFVNLRFFRKIGLSDFLRFTLSILFSCLALNYELSSLINFVYLGFIFCLFVLFLDLRGLRKSNYLFYLILLSLIVISKGFFIVFFPIFLFLVFYFMVKKDYKSMFFYLIPLFTVILQMTTMLTRLGKSKAHKWVSFDFETLSDSIYKTIYFFVAQIGSMFALTNSKHIPWLFSLFSLLITIVFIILLIRFFRIESQHKKKYLLLACLFLSFSVIFLNVFVGYYNLFHVPTNWLKIPSLHFFRGTVFQIISITTCILTLSFWSFKSKKFFYIVLIFISFPYFFKNFFIKKDPFRGSKAMFAYSDWKNYYKLTNEKDYCIPINPYPWMIYHNCKKLNIKNITNLKNKNFSVRALSFIKRDLNSIQIVKILAIDKNGNPIFAKRYNKPKRLFQYYVFSKKVNPSIILAYTDQYVKDGIVTNNQFITISKDIVLSQKILIDKNLFTGISLKFLKTNNKFIIRIKHKSRIIFEKKVLPQDLKNNAFMDFYLKTPFYFSKLKFFTIEIINKSLNKFSVAVGNKNSYQKKLYANHKVIKNKTLMYKIIYNKKYKLESPLLYGSKKSY